MSPLWEVPGRAVDASLSVGAFAAREVLVDVDGPRLFVGRTPVGDDFLAYHAAEDCRRMGWVVVPTEDSLVEGLRSGELALLDALRQPWAWVVVQDFDATVVQVRRVRFADLPLQVLPAAGVTLVARTAPLLVVRAMGAALTERDIPASVVRRVMDGAMHAMKTLIEHVLDVTVPDARPTDRLRRYYDLPTQSLAFGSVQAAFGEPIAAGEQALLPDERRALDRAAQLLQRGVAAVQADAPGGEQVFDPDLTVALDALSKLLPPGSGAIESVQLGGRLVGGARAHLTREHGTRARRYLRRARPGLEPVQVRGSIRELDKDAMTFIVRSHDLSQAWPCSFSSALRDDVFTAFGEDTPVAVSGHRRAGRPLIEVVAIDTMG